MRSVFAVTDASPRTCGEPSGGGPDQRRRGRGKRQNDGTLAGAGDIFLRAGGHLVDAPFRIGLGKAGIELGTTCICEDDHSMCCSRLLPS
jgi:hypothetical protein